MKTGTKLLSVMGFASMMLFASCNSENTVYQSVTAEELAALKAGFIPISEDDMECSNLYHSTASRSGNNDGILLTFRFHRQRYNCERGFGICLVNPRPQPFPVTPVIPGASSERSDLDIDSDTGSTMLRTESDGSTYIELKFASDPTSHMGTVALLEIEEDVTGSYTTNEGITYTTTIPQGTYRYNPNLGTYGGYRIPVILTLEMSN